MNALQAKILILYYLYEFSEQYPSKQDYTSLSILLRSDKVQIPESEFARSVVNSLIEDGYALMAAEKPGSTELGIRITDHGITFLNEINKKTKPTLTRLVISIRQLWVEHWKILLPVIVTIIGIAVTLFIHFDSSSPRKPPPEVSETDQDKRNKETAPRMESKTPSNPPPEKSEAEQGEKHPKTDDAHITSKK